MNNRRSVAGIVTFNPDLDLLIDNIRAIRPQVDRLYVFDNGSENSPHLSYALGSEDVVLTGAGANLGIAAALNRIAAQALSDGYTSLLTLDQDSVAAPDLVEKLEVHLSAQAPLVAPFIADRNKFDLAAFPKLHLPAVQQFRSAASKGAITSGALVDLSALVDVGGFDENFFIDYVDYDFNMRLMKKGLRILRVNTTYISHQVGDAKRTWLRTPRRDLDGSWHIEPFYSFGHSSMRCYYKARNRVLYTRKHWRSIGWANEGIVQIPQQMMLTLLFESDRRAKLRAFCRGTFDGLRQSRDYVPKELITATELAAE